MFDAKEHAKKCADWIREWFELNGAGCNAVIGISGGIDSSVVAALCVKALGPERVIGVLMPNGEQADLEDAVRVCDELGIRRYMVNIKAAYDSVLLSIMSPVCFDEFVISEQTKINLAPRIRMATLYAVSQSVNGRVANTCNLSEDFVGYSTIYGDMAGDFSPLRWFTKTEVREIGRALGLSDYLMNKVPADGLCGKTDEENLGFTYEVLDRYIRTGVCENPDVQKEIERRHKANEFKLMPMAAYNSRLSLLRWRI